MKSSFYRIYQEFIEIIRFFFQSTWHNLNLQKRKEYHSKLTRVNLKRSVLYGLLLFIIHIIIIYIDLERKKNGYFIKNSSYLYMYYVHLSIQIGIIIHLLLFYIIHKLKPVSGFLIASSYFLPVFILFWGMINTLVGQGIHGSLTVYILSIITVCAAYLFRPSRMFILLIILQILFIYLLPFFQNDPTIVESHITNSTVMIIMALILTKIIYGSKIRDLYAFEVIQTKNKIIEDDLLIAKRIQQNIISKIDPSYKLNFDIHFKPMMQVGGDIYDIYPINENHYRIFIADATGHGVQAALITMIIKLEYDKIKYLDMTPDIIMRIINSAFYNKYYALTVFFTCAIIDINLETKEILYSSAGHPDQYFISNYEITKLNAHGKIIGVYEEVSYELNKAVLPDDGKIILFTDGIFEVFSNNEEEFGEQRIFEIIKKYKDKNVTEINTEILKDISKWAGKNSFSDDILLIGIEKKLN